MQRTMSVLVCLLLASIGGCGGTSTPPAAGPSTGSVPAARGESLFPKLDSARLQFPAGWDSFKERIQDAQIDILNKPITVEEAPAVAAEARKFATADRRSHPASMIAIPQAFLL